jgi:hypothetical protein
MTRIETLRNAIMHIDDRRARLDEERRAALREFDKRDEGLCRGRNELLAELQARCRHDSVIETRGGTLRYCLVCAARCSTYDEHPLREVTHVLRVSDEEYIEAQRIQPVAPACVSVTMLLPASLAAKYRSEGLSHEQPPQRPVYVSPGGHD